MAVCSVSECDRPTLARGWCGAHYRRWRRYGDPEYGRPLAPSNRGQCRIEGCTNPAWHEQLCPSHHERLKRHGDPLAGRTPRGQERWPCKVEGCNSLRTGAGFCEKHYRRFLKHGSPTAGRRRAPSNITTEERYWLYVDKRVESECWPWMAACDHKGYGMFQVGQQNMRAHRYSYELAYGPIPSGHQIHHICNNKGCQNPTHLKAMMPGAHNLIGNGFSGRNAQKTHCKRGHALTPENCYQYPGRRVCKLCARERVRKQR